MTPTSSPVRRPLRTPGPSEAARVGAAVEGQAAAVLLWDLATTARALSVSTRTVRRMAADADLPYVRLPGGGLRFEPHVVQAFVARCRVGGAR